MKKFFDIIKTILLLFFILFIIFFAINNSETVKISFNLFPFNYNIEIRLFLLIILCVAVGFILGIVVMSYDLILKYLQNFKNNRKLKQLEKDIEQLKDNNSDAKE